MGELLLEKICIPCVSISVNEGDVVGVGIVALNSCDSGEEINI